MMFGEKTFKVAKEFVYLGFLVTHDTPNNDMSLKIQDTEVA
jgi:hypothetical protein